MNARSVPPVLVLGLGNILLGDDGVGPRLVQQVQNEYAHLEEHVECVDGGTQGLALLGYFGGREAVIVLDAFASGKNPGEVSILDGEEIFHCPVPKAATAHEGNAGELLAAARLLGELPRNVFLVGVEPASVRTRLGLSESVSKALPRARTKACELVDGLLVEMVETAEARGVLRKSKTEWPSAAHR